MFSLYSLFGQISSPICSMHIERKSTNHLHAAAVSVHGWRSSMEDAHNICLQLNDHGLMLWGVYDGHGGPRCAQYLSKYIPQALSTIKDIRHDHEIAALLYNIDRAFLKDENSEDGSTCCVVLGQWWDKDRSQPLQDLPHDYTATNYPSIVMKLLAINVGDSRATMINPDCSNYIAMTKDHKPADPIEYQRIIDAGGFVQSNRIDGNLALSRSFGDKQYKSNESFAFSDQKVICSPDITTHYLTPGSILLVCCDGLFEADSMTYELITNITKISKQHYSTLALPPSELPTTYIDLPKTHLQFIQQHQEHAQQIPNFDVAGIGRDLIAKSHELGSKDNHTAIVLHFLPTPHKPLHEDGYEFIPGPCHSLNPDTTYLRCYRTDIPSTIQFKTVVPKISAVDRDYLAYCHWFEHMMQFINKLSNDIDLVQNNTIDVKNNNDGHLEKNSNNSPRIQQREITNHPISSQSKSFTTYSKDSFINLYYPYMYYGSWFPTGSSLMPLYYPDSRSQYPEWLDAFIQHGLSHGDDCDYY